MRPLTELEHTVLSVMLKLGAMSPYAVRRHFSDSPTLRFSGSTGSIYPMLGRLEERGLVASKAAARGRQARREVSVTRTGADAVRVWLTAPPAPADIDPPPDALRLRLYFIGLLDRDDRERFFDTALVQLRECLRTHEAYADQYDASGPERISRLAARGSVIATRARIRWMLEVRRALLDSE